MIFFCGNTVKLPPYIIPTRGTVIAIHSFETSTGTDMGILVEFEVPRFGKKRVVLPPEELELVTKEQLEAESLETTKETLLDTERQEKSIG